MPDRKSITQTTKSPAKLNTKFNERLISYAVAAGATAATALSLGQTSMAEIVYTPANIQITQNGGLVSLDLNGDGITDFLFSNFFSRAVRHPPLGDFTAFLSVMGEQPANAIGAIESKNELCAGALVPGDRIWQKSPFGPPKSRVLLGLSGGSAGSTQVFCPWGGQTTRDAYIGVKFIISGQLHFGWARIHTVGLANATITGYAYETVAGKGIDTGKTSGPYDYSNQMDSKPRTLGELARGAASR